MIPGIVLAAGQSSRMGRPKALLATASPGETFVSRLSRTLLEGGVADVLIVGRPDDDALAAEVRRIADAGTAARLVLNHHAERGQLSSVVTGLNAADRPGVTGILIVPVDVPLIRAATVRLLLAEFSAHRDAIVRATFGGRHGHPVIFARQYFDALRRADPTAGAKAVLHAHGRAVLNVESNDPAVVHDIDAPEDYARVFNAKD
ncbi:MAG TPA: nucleotidyltransferase family protein [Vicinamibacterales bacterium]|nr:nucleotidyltransferase family protein [Vicinamibacterales bacterium]